MSRSEFTLALFSCLALSGCATASLQDLRPIDERRITEVIGEIKRQIGVYVQYQNSPEGYEDVWRNSRETYCGNGLVGFDIKFVRMELLSTTDTTIGVSAGTAYGPIAGSLGLTRSTGNSQTLVVDYDVLPSRFRSKFDPVALDRAPIASLMKNLWSASRQTGNQETHACLRMKPTSSGGNTYKIGITVGETASGDITVGLTNVSLGASADFKSATGNTITVTFVPHTFAEFAKRRGYGSRKDDIGKHFRVTEEPRERTPAERNAPDLSEVGIQSKSPSSR